MPRPTKADLQAQLQALQTRVLEFEQTLQRIRHLLQMALEALPGMVLLLNENGVTTEVAMASEWQQHRQVTQLIGQPVSVLLSPTAYEGLRAILERARSEQRTLVFEHSGLGDDTRQIYEWRLLYRPTLGTLALIRRVTSPGPHGPAQHLPETLRQLQRTNRLMRLGELIAGLVHELNQPITAILHYGQGSWRRLASGSFDAGELQHAAGQIISQAERASQMLERVRRFLRGQELPFAPVNLNAVVHETLALLAPEIQQAGADVLLQLDRDLPDVLGDTVQLTQVLVNLLRNALEAVAGQSHRQVTITTRRLFNIVEASVIDNGPGLLADVQSHLFEPFFTTKPEGLGLGLAISRSLVQAHGGELIAENLPNGACFRVRLPIPPAHTSGA